MTSCSGSAVLLATLLMSGGVLALEDPTRPYSYSTSVEAQSQSPTYELSSILISDQRRVAVINGLPRAVGERIGQARVTGIGADKVILSIGGQSEILRWKQTISIKKPNK